MAESKKRKHLAPVLLAVVLTAAAVAAGFWAVDQILPALRVQKLVRAEVPEWVDVQLISTDGHSRRGDKLDGVQDIVIHYVGNPGTTAQQNRKWYENPESTVSSHFIVGLEGEIIQCVPLDEMSSATNWRNSDTISIEVCHPDETGAFSDAAYASAAKLTAWLLDSSGLDEGHIIRHYDVTGKACPLYFVEHEEAWEQFKADVTKIQRGE